MATNNHDNATEREKFNNLVRSLVEEGELEPNAISTFEHGYNLGAKSIDRKQIVRKAFEFGRASVVFEPHSTYRDTLRQMICEGDFDYTKIFEEIEYEGEKYTDISNEGADNLADYFIGLMEMIDEQRSNEAELNRREAMNAVLAAYEVEK